MVKFIKIFWSTLISFFAVPLISLADLGTGATGCDAGKICNPLNSTSSIPGLIQKVLEDALKIGIPIVALAIIYCGFLFVFARGKSEELTKAKTALLYTLIGAAILLGSWAIAKIISNTVLSL